MVKNSKVPSAKVKRKLTSAEAKRELPSAEVKHKLASAEAQPLAKRARLLPGALREAVLAQVTRPPASPAAAKPAATNQAAAKPAVAKSSAAVRTHVDSVEYDGTEFRVGDNVYVVIDLEAFNLGRNMDVDDEFEVCELCDKSTAGDQGEAPLLECSRCLRGFHTVCLTPELKEEPEGDWFCDECQAGGAVVAPANLVTLRQRYLAGSSGLGICQITHISPRPSTDKLTAAAKRRLPFDLGCCWYSRPEEIKSGRTEDRGAREIFATNLRDTIPCESLVRTCSVLRPRAFAQASNAGDDVFLCQYRDSWKGFKRLDEEGFADDSSDDEDFAVSARLFSEAKDSQDDRELPQPACQKLTQKASAKQADRSRPSKRMQGGNNWELAAAEIPCVTRGTTFEQARAALATTTQPHSLPCREKERAKIYSFVHSALHTEGDAKGCCMFIGGKPGTGKTATVTDVMRSLRKERRQEASLPPFRFVTINGLRLSTPQQAYSSLYEALTGTRLGPAAAGSALTELFEDGDKRAPMTVVLVDELDQMLKGKKQEVVYNLMEWPLQRNSRLAVIGIGNTIDLPERLLPRINSRLGDNKIAFPPYTKQDMRQIMVHRLQHAADTRAHNLLSKEALDMATIKASHTADLRKSLQLGIRAIELAEAELVTSAAAEQQQLQEPDCYNSLVSIEHVLAASREMFNRSEVVSPMCDDLSVVCQLFLAAVLIQIRITGLSQTWLRDISDRVADMVSSHRMEAASFEVGHCVMAAMQLKTQGFIHAAGEGLTMQISLADNFPDHVLRVSLCRNGAVPWLAGLNLG